MNLALTGFMGAGKTTIGRRLARILNMPFVDTDLEIAREHGAIASIFAREGETSFRKYETDVLTQLQTRAPCVVAVGGGAVIAPENRALLRKSGVIVHLAISPEGAHRRVAHRTHRPLLGESPDLETIRILLRQRAPAYADSDLAIKVEGSTPGALAQAIARWYRAKNAGSGAGTHE